MLDLEYNSSAAVTHSLLHYTLQLKNSYIPNAPHRRAMLHLHTHTTSQCTITYRLNELLGPI